MSSKIRGQYLRAYLEMAKKIQKNPQSSGIYHLLTSSMIQLLIESTRTLG